MASFSVGSTIRPEEEHVINIEHAVEDPLISQTMNHGRKKLISYMILLAEVAAFVIDKMGWTMRSMLFTVLAIVGFLYCIIHSSSKCMLLFKMVVASLHVVSCLFRLCGQEWLEFTAPHNAKVHGVILGISVVHYFIYGD